MPEDADELAADPLVVAARALAEQLLGGLEGRWRHTRGVAARAAQLAPAVPREQRPVLVAAAWLHDIGYAEALRDTGFHPVDGARHLLATPLGRPLADLVAHHSGARFVAADRGLEAELAVFDHPAAREGRLADALTTADQTTGPDGQPVDVETRLADVLRRHGPDSPTAHVHDLRAPVVRDAVARTERRLLADRLAATVD